MAQDVIKVLCKDRNDQYLQSTTTNNRLNHMMILHVHKDKLEYLDLIEVANEFADPIDSRKQAFGKFSDSDRVKEAEFHHVGTQTDERLPTECID